MKYICLGYIEPGTFEGMTEDERHAMLDECFEYNDHLRANGHLVAEVPLQPPETALTLYWKNGKVATTDGPYAETKEQLGGIQILEARDLNHAVQLVSQLPGFKYGLGPVEIRPVADISEMMKESEQRTAKGYLAMSLAHKCPICFSLSSGLGTLNVRRHKQYHCLSVVNLADKLKHIGHLWAAERRSRFHFRRCNDPCPLPLILRAFGYERS